MFNFTFYIRNFFSQSRKNYTTAENISKITVLLVNFNMLVHVLRTKLPVLFCQHLIFQK